MRRPILATAPRLHRWSVFAILIRSEAEKEVLALDWLEEVAGKLRRRNQILFAKDSPFLQDLAELLRGQSHRVQVLWALSLAEEIVEILEQKYPEELRPREALEAARLWAQGEIKMRPAQRKILDCHAVAKELTSSEDVALCHAAGQGCSVVHTPGHALGLPMYELTALVRRYGLTDCREAVEARKAAYVERLFYWGTHQAEGFDHWAGFIHG